MFIYIQSADDSSVRLLYQFKKTIDNIRVYSYKIVIILHNESIPYTSVSYQFAQIERIEVNIEILSLFMV